MKNRIKGYFIVHRPSVEVAIVISFLLLLGGLCGYAVGNMETKKATQQLQALHLDEVNRLQTSHQYTVSFLSARVSELVAQQSALSEELSLVTKDLRSAASTATTASRRANEASKNANTASKNAAKANLRIREITPEVVKESEPVKDPHKIPERIEF